MSVDIAWETITSGPDGDALSERIREFMHTKFQQITLPRFINSVEVHSFHFGSVCPEIEIKDVSDPLPDFYEDDDDASNSGSEGTRHQHDADENEHSMTQKINSHTYASNTPFSTNSTYSPQEGTNTTHHSGSSIPYVKMNPKLPLDRTTSVESQGFSFSRGNTAGIPGGTSNLGYFHLPLGGLSGAQTPLAAVASGTPFSPGPWQHELQHQRLATQLWAQASNDQHRPRTSDSIPSPEFGSPLDPSSPESRPTVYSTAEKVSDDVSLENLSMSEKIKEISVDPSDLQVIAHVKYDGDIGMTMTAQILLDYPMPSFVNIPLRLSVTGMKFDGVAILAYIKKRMHFAFLDPEDAQALAGDVVDVDKQNDETRKSSGKSSFGSLLREVQIESEIGQQTSGKQVLKNVGKVEKFVLEQVKKIFEEEFVFPSFWTFLV